MSCKDKAKSPIFITGQNLSCKAFLHITKISFDRNCFISLLATDSRVIGDVPNLINQSIVYWQKALNSVLQLVPVQFFWYRSHSVFDVSKRLCRRISCWIRSKFRDNYVRNFICDYHGLTFLGTKQNSGPCSAKLTIPVKLKWTRGNKHWGATSGHNGVTCSRFGARCVWNRWQERYVMCAWPITHEARGKKILAVVILGQGNTVLSLLKMCESCVE